MVELLRAILYGQLGVNHELQVGLGSNNPLKQVEESEVQQNKLRDMLDIDFKPEFTIPTTDE